MTPRRRFSLDASMHLASEKPSGRNRRMSDADPTRSIQIGSNPSGTSSREEDVAPRLSAELARDL